MNNVVNEKEVEALKKLRESVTDILKEKHDDSFLLRWLRARNLDPEKAEQMLRKSLQWRKQKNMDNIINDYVPNEVNFLMNYFNKMHKSMRYNPVGQWGFDKEGSPVWAIPFGYYDIPGLLHSAKKEDLLQRFGIQAEISLSRMEQQTKKLGRPITQHIIIGDMEQFGISHFMSKSAFNFLKQLFHTHDNNYPETLKAGIWINDGWKDALNKIIDPSEIPEHWGGTFQESQNGNWWDVLKLPRQIPDSYYITPGSQISAEKDTTSVTVANNDSLCIEIPVKEVGTALKWIFQTEDSDIGFGINLKTSTGIEEIIPLERVDTHLFPEEGYFVCSKVGTYEICFDNKFSYLRSKKLTYKLGTLTLEEQQNIITEDD